MPPNQNNNQTVSDENIVPLNNNSNTAPVQKKKEFKETKLLLTLPVAFPAAIIIQFLIKPPSGAISTNPTTLETLLNIISLILFLWVFIAGPVLGYRAIKHLIKNN